MANSLFHSKFETHILHFNRYSKVLTCCVIHYRSTGMAVTLAAGRAGAILGQLTFGYLLEVNCAVPIVIVASLLITGGITGIFVPNTTGIALE